MEEASRCRLLELPAELRNRIYEYALAPTGTIALVTTKSKRFATEPILAPTLLSANRSIHDETAEILYSQNRVCISVDAHETAWPSIPERRLPQRVLEKLQHVFLLLDCASFTFRAAYGYVDWAPFTALKSLVTLKVAIIRYNGGSNSDVPDLEDLIPILMPNVLERIPANVSVFYGVGHSSEESRFLQQNIERRQRSLNNFSVEELDPVEVARVAAILSDVEQGCKAGSVEDVFAEGRDPRKGGAPDMKF